MHLAKSRIRETMKVLRQVKAHHMSTTIQLIMRNPMSHLYSFSSASFMFLVFTCR